MISFYLLGSLLSVALTLIGEYLDKDRYELIQNQKTVMILLSAFLSWFGIIGTMFLLFEKDK